MTAGSANSRDDYRAIGEWYDAEHDLVVDDVVLFFQLAEVVGDPILELGCGTGRILAPLAEAGHRATGIDRSASMLDRARRRLDEHGVLGQTTLIHGSMDALPPEHRGRYGLVILSHNTLLHATTPAAQRAVLATAKEALDPRGMLALDVFNPIADIRSSDSDRVVLEGSWRTQDGATVAKYSSRRVDEAAQTVATSIWYDRIEHDGLVRRTATTLDLRYLTAPELLLMLELTGFVEPRLYGTYDLDPYVESSSRIVVTAEATSS